MTAYAISIHKSQGITLDEAVIDLSNIFESGQAYVALSRVRSLSGLKLLNIVYERFKSNTECSEFHRNVASINL